MTNPKVTNFIYELILNMSPSERRYFKLSNLQQSPNKKKNYLDLFDIIIAHQKRGWQNEKAVKKEFIQKYGKNRFDLYKHNLYNKLLQSLEAYHKKVRSL